MCNLSKEQTAHCVNVTVCVTVCVPVNDHLLSVLVTTLTDAPAAMKTVMTSDSKSFKQPRAMLPPRVAALLTWVPATQQNIEIFF